LKFFSIFILQQIFYQYNAYEKFPPLSGKHFLRFDQRQTTWNPVRLIKTQKPIVLEHRWCDGF
jgi:hypothetical protein